MQRKAQTQGMCAELYSEKAALSGDTRAHDGEKIAVTRKREGGAIAEYQSSSEQG